MLFRLLIAVVVLWALFTFTSQIVAWGASVLDALWPHLHAAQLLIVKG